jgi:Domain of unknown function (DUF1707)
VADYLRMEPTLASNADRERTVSRLAEAHVEGRLTVDELDDLTGRAHTARTVADLDTLVAGLPPLPAVGRPAAPPALRGEGFSGGQIAGAAALTILVPAGRLIGLIVALSLLRGERLPERRRLLRAWAFACAVVLAIEVVVLLVVVVGL